MILRTSFESKASARRRLCGVGAAGALLLGLSFDATATPSPDWPQWGQDPQHTGVSSAVGQPLESILADVVYDAFVEDEKQTFNGELLAHYAVPLLDGNSVYMAFTSGVFGDFTQWDSWMWSVKRLRWEGGPRLAEAWTFQSDWKPPSYYVAFWVPPFQPALYGDFVYVPGAAGTVYRVSKATGAALAHVNPFADVDPNRRVAGGLAVGPDGSVYYNVVYIDPEDFGSARAWLVRVSANDAATSADFATLTPGAPAATDPCEVPFPSTEGPFPPSPTAVPPTLPCGAQRAGLNVVPAIGRDGTVYTLSVAHQNDRYGYLIAVGPDLSLRWNASLRDILHDGCGVLLPRDNASCRDDANLGVDPRTNRRPAGRVSDQGTSSPVVLPDGSVLIGTETFYNYARGHLFKFDQNGNALATYDFGWDITPSVFSHDGTYSIRIKNNYYDGPAGKAGRFEISSLDADLAPEWSFASTTTEDCARHADGTIACLDDGFHPDGFEWCVNQPAVDAAGVTYANSEDGSLHAIGPDGKLAGEIFLSSALGAAYTPVAIGSDGVIYAQNNGHLFAVGKAHAPRTPPQRLPAPPAQTRTPMR